MKMICSEQGGDSARQEFEAKVKVAIALALQLQEKLLKWGDRMEEARQNKMR